LGMLLEVMYCRYMNNIHGSHPELAQKTIGSANVRTSRECDWTFSIERMFFVER